MKKNSTEYLGNNSNGFLSKLKGLFKRRITLMLIPHSEKKVLNLQVSLFSIVGVIALFIGLLLSFFILSSGYTGSLRVVKDRDSRNEKLEANLYEISKAADDLKNSAERFKEALNTTLEVSNPGSSLDDVTTGNGGDLVNLIGIEESDTTVSDDVKKIRYVTDYLDSTMPKLTNLNEQLEEQNEHLIYMPSIFPVKGGKGRITMRFGAKRDPFNANWYIHRGLDIGHSKGIPIVSTANGTVEKVEFQERGYGTYITISHKWAFNTRYAHLQKAIVVKGQHVKQGQVIGFMGSSGRSTAPHLHYEVRLGPNYVNPERYIGNSFK